MLMDCFLEQTRIFTGGLWVVDGTRPDHDQQAAIFSGEDFTDLSARVEYRGRSLVGCGELFLKEDGRQDDFSPLYAEIIGAMEHRIDLETLSYMEDIRAGESLCGVFPHQ